MTLSTGFPPPHPPPISSSNKRQHWSPSVSCVWPHPLNMVVCPLFLSCSFSPLPGGCSFHHGSHCSACNVQYFCHTQSLEGKLQQVWCNVFISMCYWILEVLSAHSCWEMVWKFEYKLAHAGGTWWVLLLRAEDADVSLPVCEESQQAEYISIKWICVIAWAHRWEVIEFMRQPALFLFPHLSAKLSRGSLCYNTSVWSLYSDCQA